MKQYYLIRIFENKLLSAFYEGTRRKYANCVREYLESLKHRDIKGFTLENLEKILSLMAISIRIKHKGKKPLILKDKSNFMRCYLLLFNFVERERQYASK